MSYKVTVLFENDDVLVINKPAGLIVHSDGRTEEPTLVDWILKHYPKIKGVGDKNKLRSKNDELEMKKSRAQDAEFSIHDSAMASADLRPGIVHRLDRETSGALILAKNQTAFMRLKKQFERGEVRKVYHAFVYGSVKNDEGVIDRPIARSRANPVLWSATRGRKGEDRESVTVYRVLKRSKEYTFLELYPRTGRTHQIRVHLKAINYPVVCDKLYAPRRTCALGFARLALHSRSVSFLLPGDGKRVTIEAPYPQDFQNTFKKLRIQD
ncbi:MAG: RluA family pseudouridine synthase [Candidatus Yonathbacteria bacterium]|nr:RluA family pseudouridine synthase [Candidatus Yonathbacteria bacterium]